MRFFVFIVLVLLASACTSNSSRTASNILERQEILGQYSANKYNLLGDKYNAQGKYDLALEYYSNAIDAQSNSVNPYNGRDNSYKKRAALYEKMDEKWLALEDYKNAKLLSKNPSPEIEKNIKRLKKELHKQ